jgi:RNA polymerase sigma factor (sigma-70 family)
MNDLEFVRRCASGDKQAWAQFTDRYSRLIYSYIHSVLKVKGYIVVGENINDLFQEIFLLLTRDNFTKLKTFKAKNGCSLASWLRQVVVNCAIDYIRRMRLAVSLEEENEDGLTLKDILPDNSTELRELLNQKDLLAELKDCIAKLNRDDKYFLRLHIDKGLSLEILRRHLRLSRGAIDMRKSRIVERLRDCFRSKGFALGPAIS